MREKLNENPIAQVIVIGVLLVAIGVFAISSLGGGGGEGEETETSTTSATVSTPQGTATVTATVTRPSAGSTAGAESPAGIPTPPWSSLPRRIRGAVASGRIVVILVVKGGGELADYADRAAARAECCVDPHSQVFHVDEGRLYGALRKLDAQLFVAGAQYVWRLAPITAPLGVDRVPALIVLEPHPRRGGQIAGTVRYGYLSYESIMQAVRDANYKGGTLPYHP